jgi:hypothetical protein
MSNLNQISNLNLLTHSLNLMFSLYNLNLSTHSLNLMCNLFLNPTRYHIRII